MGIVDNLSRRKIDVELEVESLTPITSIHTRLAAWREVSGKEISFFNLDIAQEYYQFLALVKEFRPEVIVHFAEQRSAPYSTLSERTKRYTVDNNINATNNVLCAIVESGLDIYLVHLGSIGVYGYHTTVMEIPEGYLKIQVQSRSGESVEQEILYPADTESIYHMTKAQDQLLFHYYNKNNGIRITDLHQGNVWGTRTQETKLDERLINRFDYDGVYGTVLNRFIIQAAVGYPLTVYGNGGQTRAFIHIQDTTRCIELAINNPPPKGAKVQIFNQITQTHRIKDLAETIAKMIPSVKINYVDNPRKDIEDKENEFFVAKECFLSMGLKPIFLEKGLIEEIHDIANKYQHRCDLTKIPPPVWT
ncbi:nucleoside-diphosphate-sugar epimerase [Thioploca ingrica]|uniref:Nucleoside-diphosphate-sugar epimerase n=1 Tax=Thioploca ingrica TaxID=40754 RepID=A0A090AK91_9GAMM|nr:nucleoside-diphosphate-sugar epimerase [Thioploca ingrica]